MNNHKTLLERIKEYLSILKAILLEVKNIFSLLASIFLLLAAVAVLVNVLIYVGQHPGDPGSLTTLKALKPYLESLQVIKLIS